MPLQLMKKIRSIRRRLVWIDFCRKALLTLGLASVLLFFYVLASRLLPVPHPPEYVLPWVAGSAAFWLLAWTWAKRVREVEAAMKADETLGLKERLSSALMIRTPKSDAEQALLSDAARCAEEIRPSRQFPLSANRELRFAAVPLLALVALWYFMPHYDLLARFAKAEEKKKQELVLSKETREETAKELEELAEEMAESTELKESAITKKIDKDMEELAKKLREQRVSPEEAMAKMSKMRDQIKRREEEIEKKLDQNANLMDKLGEGKLTKDVAKALEKGNFEKAAEELKKLAEKIQRGELSEEEKKGLQEEMKSLAEKLGQNSEMGEALKEAAEKLGEGKTGEALSKMQEAMGEMQEMEAMMSELKELEATEAQLSEQQSSMQGKPGECSSCGSKLPSMSQTGKCGSCKGDGPGDGENWGDWESGDSRMEGKGGGGPGVGEGGTAKRAEGPTAFQKEQLKGKITAGAILARMKIDGENLPGEAKLEYEELRVKYEQRAEDTIRNDVMPLENRALIRNYYDAIRDGGDGESSQPSASAGGANP